MVIFDATTTAEAVAVGALLLGLGWASWTDWKTREAPDLIWQAMAVVGTATGVVAVYSFGLTAVGLWLLVSALVIEHLFPWDERLEERTRVPAWVVEVALYGAVGLVLVFALTEGHGADLSALAPALAVYVTVLFARALFEARVLYGGADAKALMTAGLLIPFWTATLLTLSPMAMAVLAVLPFSFSMLLNAALLAIAIPIALAVQNARHKEFEFPRGFVSYRIPVEDLPHRFVWLKDPTFSNGPEAEDIDTSEEDQALRVRQMEELKARGVTRVWVTPQLPFLLVLALGAATALIAGNLVIDLLTAL